MDGASPVAQNVLRRIAVLTADPENRLPNSRTHFNVLITTHPYPAAAQALRRSWV